MKYTRLLIFVVLLMVASMISAQESVAPGDVVEGTAEGADLEYSFTAVGGTNYLIALNSDDFDPLVSILDESGAEIGSDDDSGGSLNALLNFAAPADGTYTIVVSSWSGGPSGAFTLSVSELTVTKLVYGEVTTVELSGTDTIFFSFDGTAGDFVTISADSAADELDTELALLSPNGDELAFDDDGGVSLEPVLISVLLPETGTYQVTLAPGLGGTELFGTVDMTVQPTEGIVLGGEPVTLTLGEEFDYSVVYFEAQAGSKYSLSVESSSPDSSPYITIDDGLFGKYLNADGFSQVSAVFTAETDGLIAVRVESFYTFEATDVTLSIVAAE